jgi:hypothetical protein
MHRFYWDLHYPSTVPSAGRRSSAGVWAPPGNYIVELSAGGQKLRQPLTLKADPRVKLPEAALAREFDLATKVEAGWAKASTALAEASHAMDVLAQEKGRGAHPTQTMESIFALSDLPVPSAAGKPQPLHHPQSLKSLVADFQKLEQAVDGADADPSPDAQASYAALSKMLAAAIEKWDRLKQTGLSNIHVMQEKDRAGQ